MLFYIIIFIIIFLLSYVDLGLRIKQTYKFPLFVIIILFFFVLSFIRSERGTDWDSYYDFFMSNVTYSDFKSCLYEPLFTLINYLIKILTDKYHYLLMVLAFIIFPLKSKIIWKYSPFPFVSILVFYVLYRSDVFFVRETISLAICFFSINYIIKKNILCFFVAILLATLFHSSSLIFIPAYYIYHININIKTVIISLIIILILSASAIFLLEKIAFILGGRFMWVINAYIDADGETFGIQDSPQIAMLKGLINRGIFVLLFIYVFLKNNKSEIFVGLFNLYLFSIVLFLIFLPLSYALTRLSNSYEQVLIILIPISLKCFNIKSRRILIPILGLYLFVRFYSFSLTGSYSDLFVPYKSIF